MRKIVVIITIMVMLFCNIGIVNASSTSDLKLAKNWTKSHYSEPIKVVNDFKVPKKRKGTVYIEKLHTKSDGGRNGHTIKGNYYVKYPKKIKKGKKVTMYCVWNPKNNACDDVVAVVCLGMVK